MLHMNLKIILFILLVGCFSAAKSKECYNCEGINCLRTSKVTSRNTCVDPLDNCVTVFERFTVIARGCYSTLPIEHRKKCDAISDSECHVCYKDLCNDRGAISCLQCNSKDNVDCRNDVSKIQSTRCAVSTSPNIYCYTRKSLDKIERGCLVDTNEQVRCLGDTSCEMCMADSEDTCNRQSTEAIESTGERAKIYSVLLLATWITLTMI